MIIPLILAALVILLCAVFSKLSNKIGVPVLLAFLVLGMMFGSDGIFRIPFSDFQFAEQICSIGLIFIIFYGGFGTNWKIAKKVAVPSLVLSSAGVVITAFLVAVFCYTVLNFGWLEAVLLGSIVSSTDAASVFSVLRSKRLNLKYGTASMLELESGSNDPWAYMLTVITLGIMKGQGSSAADILLLAAGQIFFGLLFGIGIAALAAITLRHMKFEGSGWPEIFMVAVAILSYALPSFVGGNGYLSAYLAGIILGNQELENKSVMVHFFDGITGLVQIMVFFLLGLLSFPSSIPAVLLPSVGIALVLTFICRPIAVAACLLPFRAKIAQQALVSWAGLRGATSVVFAIMATVSSAQTPHDVFHISLCIVLLSIGIQGTLLPFVSRRLHMIDNGENVLKTFNDYIEKSPLQVMWLEMRYGHPWIGKKISELYLPPKVRLAMVMRGDEKILPYGKTVIEEGDRLAVSALANPDDNAMIPLYEEKIERGDARCDKRISEIDWENSFVVMILRGKRTIIPDGAVVLHENDIVVLAS